MLAPNDREEALFEGAVQLEPAARAEYLARECGPDAALRERIHSLLAAHDRAGAFLEKPVSAASFASTVKLSEGPKGQRTDRTEKPGDQIGRYKLLQQIGEGGCGVVYMAEQEEPVRRRVALKIIKVGMDTRRVIARFEAERQALAMMDHPNIARVLDAGATETGRPFFVMDLVRGIRITEYCDQNHLSMEERLSLFAQVCHAIQHAHQKGIIHRDIKPSNILVTLHDGVPVPVIIDFGIAKATEHRLTDKTLFTAFEQFIGTPAYMSPEQAEMSRLDIDTRSDIYSLGVLLYELLTGKTPFDAKALLESGLDQLRHTIREKEPLRPSTCLSTMLEGDLNNVAKHRHAEAPRLISLLRGDLDWIVMKCLEKDRTRRYETASALALDIQRFLRNEPVFARPPSRVYLLRKLIRRNRVAFAAGTAVAAALVAGLGVSTNLFVRERDAFRRMVVAERVQSRLRHEAEAAHATANEQRRTSEENARRSRLNSYAADIYSASLALQSGNLGRALDLLERQIPQKGEEDLRGFEWRYLWKEAQGDELISLPHGALVSCATFSSDARHLATASYDGVARIWDLASQRVLKSFEGFDQQFGWRYLTYSPGGRWLAGVRQGKLTVWDCDDSGYPIRFEEPTEARTLAVSDDGSLLAGWGDGGLVLVDSINWQSATIRTELKPGSFPCLALDRSGKLAALGHEGSFSIEIWNLEARMRAQFFMLKSTADMAFVSLAWSPDGLLAASTWGGRVLLVDSRTGQELISVQAHRGSVFGLAFSPNGKILITAGHDQLIHLWSMPDLKKLATFRGHRDEIWSLASSADGRLLCTAGKDGTAKVWSPEPKPEPIAPSGWYAAAFSPDGKSFATLSEPVGELTVDFWDMTSPGARTTKTLPVPDLNHVRAILSPDAKLLGLGRPEGAVELWSLDSARMIRSMRTSGAAPTAMDFSLTGELLAFATADGKIQIWNLRTWQLATLDATETQAIVRIRFAGGSHFLRVGATGRRTDRIWDLRTGAELPIPPSTERFEISPDGRTMATSSNNYVVTLWDLPAMSPRASLRGHRWIIYSMAFSADSKLLATGGADGMAKLWDTASGQEIARPLRGHLQGVTDLAFSPDGKTLATGSTDHSVKLWHVASGRELVSFPESAEPVFSPNGSALIVETELGTRLFHVPSLAEIDAERTPGLPEP